SKDGATRSAGFGVGKYVHDLPFAYSGTTGASDLDTLSEYYSGAIWLSTKQISEGGANSINGLRFHFRNKAVNYTKGLEMDFEGSPVIRGINAHEHNYSLGTDSYKFNESYIRSMYGTVGGASSHNAKTNIENIDGRQAFDYFDMMNIKSFYYKDEDYTNKFNRKVSPIIEQLDPVLENLYKV